MPYQVKLRTILRDRSAPIYARLGEIEGKARPLLSYTSQAFPYFTPHDFVHSEQVEENLDWIIPDDVKKSLGNEEIFFLIIAAWLHDWGMVCKPGEAPEQVRPIHHLRTEQNFEEMHNLLGLDLHEARIIGRIARGHRVEDIGADNHSFDKQLLGADIHIDVRFLAAALRLADECDITHNRVPELIYYSLNPQGASEEHFRRHMNIQGIGKYVPHKIEFNAVATDPKGSQALHALQLKIQKEIDNVKVILAERGIPIEYVEAHIDARGFIDKPIAFQLDEERITRLLIGQALYSRKDVAIRELLQNAIDACRLRKSLQPTTEVWIRIFKEDNRIVIMDNGIGMDFDTALSFLAKKGFSYYESEEFRKIRDQLDFDPINKWGLGILSCFLIASDLAIETKKEGKNPCRFIIHDVAQGWRYEEASLGEPGTTITLTLNSDGSKIDLEHAIRHYIKSSSIPIFIGRTETTPMVFDWSFQDIDVQDDIRRRSSSTTFVAGEPIEYDDEDLSIRYYPISDPVHGDYLEGKVFLAQQGFFVESSFEEEALPMGPNAVCLVNTKRNLLDLTISRDKVITTVPSFKSFVDRWIVNILRIVDKDYDQERTKLAKTRGEEIQVFYRVCNFHDLLDLGWLGLERRSLTRKSRIDPTYFPPAYSSFLRNTLPIFCVRKEGLWVCSLESLKSSNIKRIMLYSTPYPPRIKIGYLDTVAEIVSFQVGQKLKDDEIIILNPGISLYAVFLRSLLQPYARIEEIELGQVFRETNLPTVMSGLEEFLPGRWSFSHFPTVLRGGVICSAPCKIEFVKRIAGETYVNFIKPRLVRQLVGLSKDSIAKTEYKIIREGTIVFDLDDDFVQLLVSNIGAIKSAIHLQEMVRDYFSLLAYTYLKASPFILLDDDQSEVLLDVLEGKEKEIGALLESKKEMEPKKARLGKGSIAMLGQEFLDPVNVELDEMDED